MGKDNKVKRKIIQWLPGDELDYGEEKKKILKKVGVERFNKIL